MKKSIEIYGYRKILDRALDSLKSSGICEENKEAILKFQEQCFSEGLSLARIIKYLVLVLYESGCRIGEILSLRIKHACFDEYGAQLIVNGKTGSRRVRIIASAPSLASWLDNHPLKDSESPLWISLRSMNEPLTYSAAKELLKELARRAGIRKRVYPHLFRHSRATMLANFLTEVQMNEGGPQTN
jgi:integrase